MTPKPTRLFLSSAFVEPARYTGATRHCDAHGCGKPTQGGKPYCPDHVGQMPYAQQVAAEAPKERRKRDPNEARCAFRGCRRPFTPVAEEQRHCSRNCAQRSRRASQREAS